MQRRSAQVLGSRLSFVDVGSGPAVVFLHGNPTSSYLWRTTIGPVAGAGWRCLAVDLIGMGRSGRPSIEYRLVDHLAFVEAFLDSLAVPDVVLVGHDWGAVIALALTGRRPDLVRGVAFLEGHLHEIESWTAMDAGGRELFSALRTPGVGERLVHVENVMIEKVLQAGTLRTLTPAELDAYREPFTDPAHRGPMLRWTREIPIEGEPADVVEIVRGNQGVLAESDVAKLLLHGTPGAVIGRAEVEWCSAHARSLTTVAVGPGIHFLPEDQPAAIAAALVEWLPSTRR